MFQYCRSLITLDISNFDLSSSNTNLTSYLFMFQSLKSDCQVIVRDIDARDWVLTASNTCPAAWTTSNVIIKS